jgi:PAS domain-containing protein
MEAYKNEDLLHSAALQTAKSVLAEHHRNEHELTRAKEQLEMKAIELDYSLAILRATLESTSDGILVTDGLKKIIDFNEKYVAMFGVPR